MAKVTPQRRTTKSTANVTAFAPAFSGRIANTNIPTTIFGHKTRVQNLLHDLQRIQDAYRAIELVTEEHPDAALAANNYIRLANNGFTMEIFTPDGKKNDKDAESRWTQFCQRIGGINSEGYDGIIDQMHSSLIRFAGIGVEIESAPRVRDIAALHLILPQWLTWELDNQSKWHPFQQQGMKKIDLLGDNFIWASLDTKVGMPIGSLMFNATLMAIERQLQFFDDLSAVLRRAGYPRNDLAIDRAAVIAGMPAPVKNDAKKMREYLNDVFDDAVARMRRLDPRDDFIHFDDIVFNKTQGENSRTIDARSYMEIIDPQVINSLQSMGILLNRTGQGTTETWGTVQFKVMVLTIQSIQRKTKRLTEEICRRWMRINGIQGSCKFTHNPVDWEAEEKRMAVALKKQEYHRRGEEYVWEDKATAAKEGMGVSELPNKPPESRTAYITKILPPDGSGEKNQGAEEED